MATSQEPVQAQGRTLLVFDFDWSLIEENSDTWVLQHLGAEAFYKAGRAAGTPWTKLMDQCLQEAASQLGRTPDDVAAALHATPFEPALVSLMRALQHGGGGGSGSGGPEADVIILSDANTVFIDTILRHHGVEGAVAEVFTNPSEWRDGALRVGPYHTSPHGCRHCPSNLCKGQVLRGFLQRQATAGRSYARALYVGDGRGDFCPSILLLHGGSSGGAATAATTAAAEAAPPTAGAADKPAAAAAAGSGAHAPAPAPCGAAGNVVYAREEYPDGSPCSLWVMLRTEGGSSAGGSSGAGGGGGAASPAQQQQRRGVVGWTRPQQLAALLRQELGLPEAD